MCYNQPMSILFFSIGTCATIYTYSTNVLRNNYIHLITGFYTIMELSQAIEYSYVNDCDGYMNKFLSEIAYILVIVQPLLFHVIGYLRNRNSDDRKVFKVSITMFLLWMSSNIYSRLIYTPVASLTSLTSPDRWSYLYSDKTCIMRYSSTSHLYWQWSSVNMYDYHANFFCYLLIWFIPPLFVKKERKINFTVMMSFFVGTVLTMLSNRWEEHASIWCFVSIPVSLVNLMLFNGVLLKK